MLYLYVPVKYGQPLRDHPKAIEAENAHRAIELAAAECAAEVLDGAEIKIMRFGGCSGAPS